MEVGPARPEQRVVKPIRRFGFETIEHGRFGGVDFQHDFGRRHCARNEAFGDVEIDRAFVSNDRFILASHPTEQVTFAMRPSRLVGFSLLDQSVELEGMLEAAGLESSVELFTKVNRPAVSSSHWLYPSLPPARCMTETSVGLLSKHPIEPRVHT